MAKRKAIPKAIRDKLLVEAMHRCCLCPEHHDVTDLHHIVPISEDGPNTEDNLMVICPTCHAKIHRFRRSYTVDQLRMYKERWVRLCGLGLPLDVRMAQAFDYTRPPTPPQMPPGIPPPPAPYIAHPYPAQAHFTGRERERADLTAWLEDGAHPLLAVIAIGGMGKTALGWHWFHNDLWPLGFDHWGLRGALWWSFYDWESDFERFLERTIAYVSGGEMDATNWPVRDQMDCLRALLAEHPFLLMLDGVERLLRAYARMDAPYLGDEEVEAQRDVSQASLYQCANPNVGIFLQWLAGLGATKTLLTSRLFPRELEGLAGVTRRDLTQMDLEDAVRFFRAMGIKGTRAEIQAACARYGYHPLALRLLAGLIACEPARISSARLAPILDIKLTGDFERFTRADLESVVLAVSGGADISPSQVRILRVSPGTVQIILEVPEGAAHRLFNMYMNGDPIIKNLFIQRITFSSLPPQQPAQPSETLGLMEKANATQPADMPPFLNLRLEDLADNIRQDLALLKDYEDALRYEDDPRRRAKYHREIEQLRKSAVHYQRVYDELRAQMTGEPSVAIQGIASQLRQMDTRLNMLLVGQTAVRDDLINLRKTLLTRFDTNEQTIIAAMVERLDQRQLAMVQAVLDAIEARHIPKSQLQETLTAVQHTLVEIRQQAVALSDPTLVSEVERLSEIVDASHLDVKHKLKVTAPIIPFILSYEGEVELKSGLNLEAAWHRLVAKVRGER